MAAETPADPHASAPAPAQAAARAIRFFHRGEIVGVSGVPVTRSLLDWLREDAGCTGTKEGCAEGDCGACTVVVGELDGAGALRLRTVNACMQFVPALDGKALLTVEDLKGDDGSLHPVQRAMVECHGSQCGFCTPGFVMSLAACYERHAEAGTRPGRQALADELSGNLCRCTGYRPILDAGERMFELPPRRLDRARIVAALQALGADPPLHYEAPNPAQRVAGVPRTDRFDAPRSVDALAALLEARPQSRLLAGCTDLGLWVSKQLRDLGDIVHLGEVAELKALREEEGEEGGTLLIGAGVPLEDAWAALAQRAPALREVWLRFASPPIRHAGTMGGNVANGSPIGDSAPVLMALGCTLLLRRGTRVRRLALEDFYLGYMKNALEPGEFVQALQVRLPGADTAVHAWKMSKRYDSDISALLAAFALTLADDGRVRAARLAFGGMAAVVKRAAQAEAALLGQPWTEATAEAAAAALAQDFTPLTDLRASAGHRLRVAQNLLRRLWLATRREAPLAAGQTSVWAAMQEATQDALHDHRAVNP